MPEPTSLRHHRASPTTTERTFPRATKTTPAGKWSATLLLASALGLPALAAHAQDAPPPGAPPAAPPGAPPEAPPPAPPPPPPAAVPPPAVEAAAKPPTATETMPATRPEVLPPIDVGAWVRAGSIFQSVTDPKSVSDWHMDNAYVELHAGGKIHPKVGVTVNLNANYTAFSGAPVLTPPATMPGTTALPGTSVAIEDAIISFDFCDPFHLWAGHLLVPVDRSNLAGPFFMIPWNYPGFYGIVSAPKEGPYGRNNGAVLWGEFNQGQVKYFAGVFDDSDVTSHPFFSGRVNVALVGTEPGFWGNSSYFGDKDVLALGLGGQYQKATLSGAKNYTEVNADLLGEFKLGGGAWATGEAAYYHFGVDNGSVKDSYYVLAALASGVVGVGNIQPMVRYQGARIQGGGSEWNIDGALSYLIKGPALRVIATYSHFKFPDPAGSANSIQLGAQAIFF